MMSFYELQNYKVGDVITKMVHYTNGGTYTQWDNNGRKYCYNFVCKNVEGHEVDYLKLDEDNDYCEDTYGAEYANEIDKFDFAINIDCIEEKEILVNEFANFKIISIASNTEEDFNTEEDEPAYECEIVVEMI